MAFIERLATGDAPGRGASAIARHLSSLLNTARGFGAFLPDYGLGDCVSLLELEAAPSGARLGPERLRADVEETVRRYEPGLGSASARLLGRDDRGHVIVLLEGSLAGARRRFAIDFDPITRKVSVAEAP